MYIDACYNIEINTNYSKINKYIITYYRKIYCV